MLINGSLVETMLRNTSQHYHHWGYISSSHNNRAPTSILSNKSIMCNNNNNCLTFGGCGYHAMPNPNKSRSSQHSFIEMKHPRSSRTQILLITCFQISIASVRTIQVPPPPQCVVDTLLLRHTLVLCFHHYVYK